MTGASRAVRSRPTVGLSGLSTMAGSTVSLEELARAFPLPPTPELHPGPGPVGKALSASLGAHNPLG